MSAKCEQCYGKGFHTTQQTCPDCKGTGSKNLILGVGSSNQKNDCQTCKGKGKLFNREQCDTCEGTGKMQNCLVCGNSLEQEVGVGSFFYISGTGDYKKLIGKKCYYAVRYLNANVFYKHKCDW